MSSVRFPIPARHLRRLDALAARYGVSRRELLTRLIRWFAGQGDVVQLCALRLMSDQWNDHLRLRLLRDLVERSRPAPAPPPQPALAWSCPRVHAFLVPVPARPCVGRVGPRSTSGGSR